MGPTHTAARTRRSTAQADSDCDLSNQTVRTVTDQGPDLLRGFRGAAEPAFARAVAEHWTVEPGALVQRFLHAAPLPGQAASSSGFV